MTLYGPRDPQNLSLTDVERYFDNASHELEVVPFTAKERRRLLSQMMNKLVDHRTRQFFLYHFCPLLTSAVAHCFRHEHPTIVELGCGSGTSSILFALLGARVVGVDRDPRIIDACRKRQDLYEAQFGPLDLRFEATDAFSFDYGSVGAIDAIYSLFAFNLMRPSDLLIARTVPFLHDDGRYVISDMNMHSLYNRAFRPRPSLTPTQMQAVFAANQCSVRSLVYDCLVPPKLARFPMILAAARRTQSALASSRFLRYAAVSYTIVAERVSKEYCTNTSGNRAG